VRHRDTFLSPSWHRGLGAGGGGVTARAASRVRLRQERSSALARPREALALRAVHRRALCFPAMWKARDRQVLWACFPKVRIPANPCPLSSPTRIPPAPRAPGCRGCAGSRWGTRTSGDAAPTVCAGASSDAGPLCEPRMDLASPASRRTPGRTSGKSGPYPG
jgi:hypothetical protein